MKSIIIENRLKLLIKVRINELAPTSIGSKDIWSTTLSDNTVRIQVKSGFTSKTLDLKGLNKNPDSEVRVVVEKQKAGIDKLLFSLLLTMILGFVGWSYFSIQKNFNLYFLLLLLWLLLSNLYIYGYNNYVVKEV